MPAPAENSYKNSTDIQNISAVQALERHVGVRCRSLDINAVRLLIPKAPASPGHRVFGTPSSITQVEDLQMILSVKH